MPQPVSVNTGSSHHRQPGGKIVGKLCKSDKSGFIVVSLKFIYRPIRIGCEICSRHKILLSAIRLNIMISQHCQAYISRQIIEGSLSVTRTVSHFLKLVMMPQDKISFNIRVQLIEKGVSAAEGDIGLFQV